ncbi:MAG: hypothetical protein R3B68_02940 [Phycisphaerales bacterium]
MGDNPYRLLVSPRLRAISRGAVMHFEITGGQLFMSGDGRTHTYNSLRWYYFNDRDKGWLTGNQVYRQPKDPWRNAVEIEFDMDLDGQWTVLAQIKDMNNKEFFCKHDVWIEKASTILDSELAAAQKEGLPDLYATMIMTTRYKRALEMVAAKHPPTGKQKTEHDALIAHLSQNELKLADLYAEFIGRPSYKINAVHIETTTQTKSRLRVVVAKMEGSGHKWKLIDWTNPLDRTRTGIYEREAASDGAAIIALLDAWDSGNRYPDGHIRYVVPQQFFEKDKNVGQFETDGSSFWDSVASFFEWIALGAAVVAGVVTLIAPIPGSQVVSMLIWSSILSSSAAAVINIAQRREEGVSDWRADALDGLTIVGNIFAGAGMWARGATIIAKDSAGKVVKYSLIGQVGTDGVQGVMLAQDYIAQYDAILGNPSLSPKERTDKLLELFRSAAIAGMMTSVSIKGTATDLANMRKPGVNGETPAARLERMKDPGAEIDMTGTPKADGDAGDAGGHTTKTQDDHATTRREDPTNVPPPKGKPRQKTRFPTPPPPGSRGMRDMDDKIFGAKAKATDQYIFVRDGNADGVQFIGKSGTDPQGKPFKYEGKPMEMKAKTATEGPYKGVVCFDPTHARTHNTLSKLPGHPEMTVAELLEGKTVAQLMADPNSEFRKRYDYFKKKKIEDSGFKVMDDDHYVVVHAQTNARYHGDYDLHGVYKKNGEFVPDTSDIRAQINTEMDAKLIQHGAHDEWPDRQNPNVAGENAGPQPPVTVYMPDGSKVWIGGTGSKESDRVLFKKFFEENGLQWRYDDWEALPGNKIDTGN